MALPATNVLRIVTCLWFTSMFFTATAQSNGIGTFYTPPYQPSACYGFEDQGMMIGAASKALWNDGGACGQYYQVKCVGARNQGVPMPCYGSGTVVVKIVDRCLPNLCRGTIDFSQEAFASIADPNAGDINIQYQQYVTLF
ncbi:EG45-like domain containing protein [Syzygium oleosum]|uniref:EG45-like domain containing protein n=1 Tax=Syzygium oleosum TaxID=219896 RepID=UPI0024B96611|nr:EG45-like domain containing protein [Syzygium oleosum]